MSVSEGLILDPPEFIQNRVAVDLQQEGLEILAQGLDYGESSAQVEMVRKAIGEGVVDRRWPAVECTVPLIVREEGETSLAASNHNVEAKVGLWQQRGGWIRRDFADAAGHSGSVGCPVFTAGLTPVQGWTASHRQVAPDVALKLKRWPIWYATVEIEGAEVKASGVRDLKWEIAEMLGTAPGLIRVRIKNENATEAYRALISSIESEHFSSAATADLVYEAEALTPTGGAKVVEAAGASGGKVVEHSALTAGWVTILGSEIAGTGHMTHTGVRWPRMRVEDPSGGVQLQLEWRSLGSTKWSPGPIVESPVSGDFQIVTLGECRPETAILGDQAWEWRLRARAPGGSGAIRVDRVWLCAVEQTLEVATPSVAQSADAQEQKSPGTAANNTEAGTVAWSNPGNAVSSNNSAATMAAAKGTSKESHYLQVSDFAFGIPEGATITGIGVEIERKAALNSGADWVADAALYLMKAGVRQSSGAGKDKADNINNWPTVDTYKAYGGSADLWANTWTVADVNNSGFGVAFRCIAQPATAEQVASVDHIRVTVYYTEAEDENRVCFATRSIELRSDGVHRQHPTENVWGNLFLQSGALPHAPAGGLEKRGARGIIIPSQGDLLEQADSGTNNLSVQPIYQPGYLFAREAAG